ncbi:MAG: hypothetical protein KC912_15280 [Proteobacteria bacterium]|nr:hypothetical protein [Pseudomonadota bacterium]
METARRAVVASLVSVALIAGFVLLVGLFSPSEWRARARATTTAPTAAVVEQLASREAWEAGRGQAETWTETETGLVGEWVRGTRTQRVEITPGPTGAMLSYQSGALQMTGEIEIEDVGERRVVVWTQRGDVGTSPLARFAARFASGPVETGLRADLQELLRLSEGLPDPETIPGMARGRVLEPTWACPEFEQCSTVRLLDPLEFAGTDVRVRALLDAEACVRTPLPDAAEGALPEAEQVDCDEEEGDGIPPAAPEG